MNETNGAYTITEQQLVDTVDLLEERIAELEGGSGVAFAEDTGWSKLGAEGGREFSRDFLKQIAGLSRLMFLQNPLINRAVTLQSYYVFGQGVNISARHPLVNEVVQRFLDDQKNRAELTGHQARTLKEQALQIEGNLFFVLFTNRVTGRMRIRTLPFDEIAEIVCNPEDAKETWFYRRVWSERHTHAETGVPSVMMRTAFYPDWQHDPRAKPTTLGEHPVLWDVPVYHVKVGGTSDMCFGIPETYAALNWARAYKVFLENVATMMQAYSRFAGKLTTKGGARGAAAAKARLAPPAVPEASEGRNPSPAPAGSLFVGAEGVDHSPFNLRGASISPEDGRRFLLMVAAAVGLPEPMFGDANVGNHATAKTLDRPTELKFRDRQTLWADVHRDILQRAVDCDAVAPRGTLAGHVETDDEGVRTVVLADDPETGEPIDRHIVVDFPPILEHDVDAAIKAIVTTATLDGKALAGTIDAELTTRLLLQALGVDDIDEVLAALFPEDQENDAQPTSEALMVEAVRDLRTALGKIAGGSTRDG